MEPKHGLIQKDEATMMGVCTQCGTVRLHRRGSNKDGSPKLRCSNAADGMAHRPVSARISYKELPFWPDAYSVFQGPKRIGTVRRTCWVQNGRSRKTWTSFTDGFVTIIGEYPDRATAARAIAAGTRRGHSASTRVSLMEPKAA